MTVFRVMLVVLVTLAAPVIPATATPLLLTHLMIWQSSSEPWWSPFNTTGYKVVSPLGELRSIDWLNFTLVHFHLSQVRTAGISGVIFDLTNEFGKFIQRAPSLQRACAQHGLRAVAQVAGSANDVEAHAMAVWETMVKSEDGTYLLTDGKPLLVVYVTRPVWDQLGGNYTDRFTLRWSSGEDSNPEKFGWQLERWVGPEPSHRAMYVTPSIGHDPAGDNTKWRKSVAWLDFGMLMARRYSPEMLVVGSYDDVVERNAWLMADTSEVPAERMMRDTKGSLSVSFMYERVKSWASGSPQSIPGGTLRDGAYRILNRGAPMMMRSNDASLNSTVVRVGQGSGKLESVHQFSSCEQCGKAVCKPSCEPHCCSIVTDLNNTYFIGADVKEIGCERGEIIFAQAGLVCDDNDGVYAVQNGTAELFWLYHLGGNTYRILPLNSGLALERTGATVSQQWPSSDVAQHWCLQPLNDRDGEFVVQACGTRMIWELDAHGNVRFAQALSSDASPEQVWSFLAEATI